MKIYFYRRSFDLPNYLFGEPFPERFTFATNQEKLPPSGSFLIFEALDKFNGSKFYVTKIKTKSKITTFDFRISCVDVKEIAFTLSEVVRLLNLKERRLLKRDVISLIADKAQKTKALIAYLKEKNASLSEYFKKKEIITGKISIETGVQTIDAFATALDIFGLNRHSYTNLTEEQIMDWEIEKLSPFLESTPDGKHYLVFGDRRLYIQKVHNTPIERCLGVDLIYHFINEHRILFIQYKCFNHDNKKYYVSKDSHSKAEISKMKDFEFIKDCRNLSVTDLSKLRICDCPIFVKLCSREISGKREEPYGFYYAICVWDRFTKQSKAFIDYDDVPKISNDLFNSLAHTGLIGTTVEEAKVVSEKLAKSSNNRLMLIFSEEKIKDL